MGACGADCGITRIREREKTSALALAERVHPGLVWSRPPIAPPAVPFDTVASIGRGLEELLPVRSLVRSGEAGSGDALYLLMGLHEPSLCQIADGAAFDRASTPPLAETYLRVPFSPYDRLVTIQEVQVHARWARDRDLSIVEEPLAGVVDVRLRAAIKGLQGALRKAGLTLLDMAFLAQRPGERPQTAYEAEFGEEPTLWSMLFDPSPPTTIRASLVTVPQL